MINNSTRSKLIELINNYGQSICQESSKCENLLQENYLQYPSDYFLLINSFRQGIPKKLLRSQNSQMPKEVTLGTLTTQLQDNLYITETAANWTVETWGIALKVIQPQEWSPPSGHSPPKPHNEPQKHLKTIIKNHSPFKCNCNPKCERSPENYCPKKIKSFLQDYCPQYLAETLLLVNSLEQGILTKLIAAETKEVSKTLSTELTQHLENQIYLVPTAAKWAVDSWIDALDISWEKKVNSSPTDLDLEETIYLISYQMQYGVMQRIVINQEAINIKVPPGTKNNTRLRLKGKGKIDPNTQQRGNLYLRIEELEIESQEESIDDSDSNNKLINLDIEETIFLTEEEMLNGVRKRLVTDDKDYDVKIPAGTKVGSRLRLQGQGLVAPHSQQQGDLYLRIKRKSNPSPVEPRELIHEDINYTRLRDLLNRHSWKEANEETKNIMLQIANRTKEGWLDLKSIRQFPSEHLEQIDRLWTANSAGRFGFNQQQKIWNKSSKKKWNKFGKQVEWLDKKSGFGNLFVKWKAENDLNYTLNSPQGHLPSWYLWLGVEGSTFLQLLNEYHARK